MLTAARIETADGIHGLPPGTGVKLIREGVYLTPFGELPLNPSQLTNDMARARAARDADRSVQAALQARIAAEKASLTAPAPNASTASAPPPTASTPSPPAGDAANQAKREELRRQETQTVNEIGRVRAEVRNLTNANPKTSPAAARLRDRNDQLREQLRNIREQIDLIPQ